jgi:hypothetical protein
MSEVIMNPISKIKAHTQWSKNLCSIRDLVAKLFIAIHVIYAFVGGEWSIQKEVLW